MNKIFIVLIFSVTAMFLNGCASSSKLEFAEETPWYEDLNPSNPHSDWRIFDVMPGPLDHEQSIFTDLNDETVFMLDVN